ncbi:hypothetical protein [Novosphingobium sp.]|uniref:hypothetical protein n=1 Tax=Novosphingobium sp. TaxID=1874826 RepID=UPI00286A72DE|nr:hypothetical protein [Novosphingobium sp.]
MTLAAASLSLAGCAHRPSDPAAAAFEANLAGHASATAALQQWCDARGIAPGETIAVAFVAGADEAPPADLRAILGVSADEQLGYRHVRLVCGTVVLSDAHNWFVPARLTAEMNRQLTDSRVPFGRVAASLNFTRQPLAAARRGDPGCPADAISTHKAQLLLPGGKPIAYVVECYTEANLAPAPRA